MSAESNVALIEGQFEAFGRGDVGEALAGIAEDVDWQAPVTGHDCDLPWAGRRRGHAEVIDYFRQIAATARPEPFQNGDS